MKKKLSIAEYLLAGLFGATILVVFGQIIFRYFFNSSLTWGEELSRYLFTWMIFLGGALCIRDNSHIRVDFIINKLPHRWRSRAAALDLLVLILFSAFTVVYGFIWVAEAAGAYSPALTLPLNWVFYGAMPVSALLGLGYAVARLRRKIKIQKEKKTT